jgi:hypothetical protein
LRAYPKLSEATVMANVNRTLIGLLVIGCAICVTPLLAATHPVQVRFIPSLALVDQPVIARLSNGLSNACWPPATSIVRVNAKITLTLDYDDACPPQYILPSRDYALGAFPAGTYTFVVMSCSNNPPPFPTECHVLLQSQFSVVPPPHIDPAPMLSVWAMLALLAGFIVAAAGFTRPFRRCPRN